MSKITNDGLTQSNISYPCDCTVPAQWL